MARAKQTNRADARRRYRQAVAQSVDDGEAGSDATSSGANGTSAGRAMSSPTGKTGRPGLGTAFRSSYRAPHYREDLQALPELVRGRWFLISLAITAAGFALFIAVPNGVTALIWSVVSLPIGGPTLPIFLVGFTAPRASYLLGPLIGIANLVLAALVLPLIPQASATGSISDVVIQGILYGLPTAVLFASGAAWYRRFLTLSNPRMGQGRGQQRSNRSKPGAKAAARR